MSMDSLPPEIIGEIVRREYHEDPGRQPSKTYKTLRLVNRHFEAAVTPYVFPLYYISTSDLRDNFDSMERDLATSRIGVAVRQYRFTFRLTEPPVVFNANDHARLLSHLPMLRAVALNTLNSGTNIWTKRSTNNRVAYCCAFWSILSLLSTHNWIEELHIEDFHKPALTLSQAEVEPYHQGLRKLKKFYCRIGSVRMPSAYEPDIDMRAEENWFRTCFSPFVRAMKSLESLQIEATRSLGYFPEFDEVMGATPGSCHWATLRKIELTGFDFTISHVQNFFEMHRYTLKKASFARCQLDVKDDSGASWATVYRMLKSIFGSFDFEVTRGVDLERDRELMKRASTIWGNWLKNGHIQVQPNEDDHFMYNLPRDPGMPVVTMNGDVLCDRDRNFYRGWVYDDLGYPTELTQEMRKAYGIRADHSFYSTHADFHS